MSELDRDGWPSADTVLATERKRNAMAAEEIQQMINDLETVRYEWTCLIPRLAYPFRRNAMQCKALTEKTLETLRSKLASKTA